VKGEDTYFSFLSRLWQFEMLEDNRAELSTMREPFLYFGSNGESVYVDLVKF
jgi:hypothetical protein